MPLPTNSFPVVEHPEVQETFADSMGLLSFDGQTLRIDLTCARVDDPKPPKPPTGRRHVVARLVLTPELAQELTNKLKNLEAQLQAIQKGAAPAAPVKH
jgi:hypothetical protein